MRAVLIAAVGLLAMATAQASALPFGSRVLAYGNVKEPFLVADLDGDSAADQIYLVSVAPGPATFAKDLVLQQDLWDSKPIGAHAQRLALAIAFGGNGRKVLLTAWSPDGGAGFFDSPIWQADPPPLSIDMKGSAGFRDFQRQEKHIRNDIIVVGTEAGIDTALYWNGKTFALFYPNEEP